MTDHGTSVSVTVLTTRAQAERETRAGVRRLLLLASTPPWKRVLALLDNRQKMALGYSSHGSVPALLEDVLAAVVDAIVAESAADTLGQVRDQTTFDRALAAVRGQLVPRTLAALEAVVPVLVEGRNVEERLDAMTAPAAAPLVADVRAGVQSLLSPGFVTAAGLARLPHLLRYLRAMAVRLEKGVESMAKDGERSARVEQVRSEYRSFLEQLPEHRRHDSDVEEIGWQIRELEVSLFAQRLGTPSPVSEKRIYAAMDRAEDKQD